jgi:hypothetical protein
MYRWRLKKWLSAADNWAQIAVKSEQTRGLENAPFSGIPVQAARERPAEMKEALPACAADAVAAMLPIRRIAACGARHGSRRSDVGGGVRQPANRRPPSGSPTIASRLSALHCRLASSPAAPAARR